MKKVSLKKAIEILGGTNIELHRGYYYCYGFFEKDGQLYYINTYDIRICPLNHPSSIMYRTAEHREDYRGGINTWDFYDQLKEKGYEVGSCPHKHD